MAVENRRFDLLKLRTEIRKVQNPNAPGEVRLGWKRKLWEIPRCFVYIEDRHIGTISGDDTPGYYRGSRGTMYTTDAGFIVSIPDRPKQEQVFQTFDDALAYVLICARVGSDQSVEVPELATQRSAKSSFRRQQIKEAGQPTSAVGQAIREWLHVVKLATGRRPTVEDAVQAFHLSPTTILQLVPGTAFALSATRTAPSPRVITVEIEDGEEHVIVVKPKPAAACPIR